MAPLTRSMRLAVGAEKPAAPARSPNKPSKAKPVLAEELVEHILHLTLAQCDPFARQHLLWSLSLASSAFRRIAKVEDNVYAISGDANAGKLVATGAEKLVEADVIHFRASPAAAVQKPKRRLKSLNNVMQLLNFTPALRVLDLQLSGSNAARPGDLVSSLAATMHHALLYLQELTIDTDCSNAAVHPVDAAQVFLMAPHVESLSFAGSRITHRKPFSRSPRLKSVKAELLDYMTGCWLFRPLHHLPSIDKAGQYMVIERVEVGRLLFPRGVEQPPMPDNMALPWAVKSLSMGRLNLLIARMHTWVHQGRRYHPLSAVEHMAVTEEVIVERSNGRRVFDYLHALQSLEIRLTMPTDLTLEEVHHQSRTHRTLYLGPASLRTLKVSSTTRDTCWSVKRLKIACETRQIAFTSSCFLKERVNLPCKQCTSKPQA